MHNISCPICLNELHESLNTDSRDARAYNCPSCGEFILTRYAQHSVKSFTNNRSDEDNRALLSHYIRASQTDNEWPEFGRVQIKKILEKDFPSVTEKSDLIIKWVGDKSTYEGEEINAHSFCLEMCSFAGLKNITELSYHVSALEKNNLVKAVIYPNGSPTNIKLTFEGWQHYDKIGQGHENYNKAFMAMQFGDNDLDNIFTNHFKPAVLETGFKLFRLDERPKSGLIDNRLRQEIKTSKFVIADLTHDNLGAYWEAGYAEGVGKEVIYTCEESKFEKAKTHFDVRHHLTIKWKKGEEQKAIDELKATIRLTFPEAIQHDEQITEKVA